MLKTILTSLYTRVFVAYKSTLVGIAVAVASAITDVLVASPNKIVSIIGSAVGLILVAFKGNAQAPAAPPAP